MSLSYAQVDEILRIIEEFPAAEIRFEYQDLKLYVRRGSVDGRPPAKSALSAPRAQSQAPGPVEAKPAEKRKAKKPAPAERKGLEPVTAPMMGVFYRAPTPGAEPYVEVGQRVSPATDLCIIEVMKVMNLIKAPCAGAIVEIQAENGAMVEPGQVLMWIKP